MMSTLISTDFGGDTFVKAISFLGCNGLLWLLYLMLFQYLPIGLLEVWQSRKHPVTIRVLETENKTDKPLPEPVTGHIVQPTVSVPPLSEEQYQSYCADFERQKQETREKLVTSILEYASRKMAHQARQALAYRQLHLPFLENPSSFLAIHTGKSGLGFPFSLYAVVYN